MRKIQKIQDLGERFIKKYEESSLGGFSFIGKCLK